MKNVMMVVVAAVTGIVMADADVDALKAVLEKVTDPETAAHARDGLPAMGEVGETVSGHVG